MFAALYASQYVGIGFVNLALTAILREQGASLAQLGMLNLLLLPMSLKFLWAPLMERGAHQAGPPPAPDGGLPASASAAARYRPWLPRMQLLMALALAAFTPPVVDSRAALGALLALLLVFAVATATQDLALDGLAAVCFTHEQRPRISSIQVGSGMLGNLVGGALVLWLYPRVGWQHCLLLLAALLAWPLLLLPAWPARALRALSMHSGGHTRGQTRGQTAAQASGWRQMLRFWRGQWQWLGLMALSATSFAAFSLLTPALVDAGWGLPDIGSAVRVFGTAAGLLSAALTALWLRRFSRQRAMALAALAQALSLLALLPVLAGRTDAPWVYAAIGVYYLAFAPLYASLGVVMMDKARSGSAPAAVYSLQTATAMLLALVLSAACMALAQRTGYVAAAGLCIACLLAAAWLAARGRRILFSPEDGMTP